MIACMALCNEQGIVDRLIQNTLDEQVTEGQDIRHLFLNEDTLDTLLKNVPSHGFTARLRMLRGGHPEINVAVKPIDKQLLFLVYDIAEMTELGELIEMSLTLLDIPEVSGHTYDAGSSEILKLNNQLVNYQRILDKTNARLKSLLQETQEAKSTLEVLERDTLTSLYTERAFYARASSLLKKYADSDFDIVAVDIEQFKNVNDAFGSENGDRLLMDLATCLLSIQTGDRFLFARARADTFFILVPRQESNYAALEHDINSFLDNHPLPIRLQVKLGVCEIHNNSLEVSRMCDRALMAAKSIKGDYNKKFAFYDDPMHEKLMMEQSINDTMEDSLKKEHFRVYLQPKVEVNTGKVIGAEALARWFHPEAGMISPGDFIPIFEKNGFIHTLNYYVWEKACEMMRNWKLAGKRTVPVSVNVSRTDFYVVNLQEILTDLVERYQLEPEDLHLEITESAYVDGSTQLVTMIKQLKNAGFIIEMDDFGSGYSSLNTLSELPIDALKMDLKFLMQTENMDRKQKIMQLVIDLAKELNIQVLAEGVETEAQALLLENMGCKHAQGYLYGRPMPEVDFISQHYKVMAHS